MQLKHCNNKPSSCNITAAYYILWETSLSLNHYSLSYTHTHTRIRSIERDRGDCLKDSMLVVALGQLGN